MDKINETMAVLCHFSNTAKRVKWPLLCNRQETKSLLLRTRRPGRERVKFASGIFCAPSQRNNSRRAPRKSRNVGKIVALTSAKISMFQEYELNQTT